MKGTTLFIIFNFLYVKVLPASLIFLLSVIVAFIAERVILKAADALDERKVLIVKFVGRSARYVILVVGVVSALGTVGVDVSAVIAGLGLTGFAVSLALKDAVSNLIAGILIIIYTPFTVGDRIKVAGVEGCVEEINLRYVSLRLDDNSMTLIPNSKVFTDVVHIKTKSSS